MIDIEAYDWNCPQHITPRYTREEIERALTPMYAQIEKLEKETATLREEVTRLRSSRVSPDNA